MEAAKRLRQAEKDTAIRGFFVMPMPATESKAAKTEMEAIQLKAAEHLAHCTKWRLSTGCTFPGCNETAKLLHHGVRSGGRQRGTGSNLVPGHAHRGGGTSRVVPAHALSASLDTETLECPFNEEERLLLLYADPDHGSATKLQQLQDQLKQFEEECTIDYSDDGYGSDGEEGKERARNAVTKAPRKLRAELRRKRLPLDWCPVCIRAQQLRTVHARHCCLEPGRCRVPLCWQTKQGLTVEADNLRELGRIAREQNRPFWEDWWICNMTRTWARIGARMLRCCAIPVCKDDDQRHECYPALSCFCVFFWLGAGLVYYFEISSEGVETR